MLIRSAFCGSGTLQLSQSFRSHRALRRGERISLALDIESVEEREGRRYFAVRTLAHDGHGDVVAEQRSNQIWAQDMGSVGAATAARSLRPAATTTRQQSEAATIGPLTDRYPMSRVRAYGELAGAMDPIHLDPKFAQAQPAHYLLQHALRLFYCRGFSLIQAVTRWSQFDSWKSRHSNRNAEDYFMCTDADGNSVDPTVRWHQCM